MSKLEKYLNNICIHIYVCMYMLFFNDNKIKITRKPAKKQKENPVGGTEEGNR